MNNIIFILTVLACLSGFYGIMKISKNDFVRRKANIIGVLLLFWVVVQSVIALNNVYNTDLKALPPKIMLFGVFPMIIMIILVFLSKKGRLFVDNLPLPYIIFLNIIRIPVELVLYGLAVEKLVPVLMTFEGRNFDILAGLTAPFMAYFAFKGIHKHKTLLLCWNILAVLLLGNIIFHALFSAPAPFQLFGFEQPNVAILYFPISLLPTFVVPLVIFSHLVIFRQLLFTAHHFKA